MGNINFESTWILSYYGHYSLGLVVDGCCFVLFCFVLFYFLLLSFLCHFGPQPFVSVMWMWVVMVDCVMVVEESGDIVEWCGVDSFSKESRRERRRNENVLYFFIDVIDVVSLVRRWIIDAERKVHFIAGVRRRIRRSPIRNKYIILARRDRKPISHIAEKMPLLSFTRFFFGIFPCSRFTTRGLQAVLRRMYGTQSHVTDCS